MSKKQCEVCIVGGGSAGIGAALAAARSGLSVILIEKGDLLGGNAVRGGVHNWEPGVGGTAFPREIFHRLRQVPNAIGVWTMGRHCSWPHRNNPRLHGGELLIDPRRTYEDTLKRHGTRGLSEDAELILKQWHGVAFEPAAYAQTVEEMLLETGNCQIWKTTSFVSAVVDASGISSIQVMRDGSAHTIVAQIYIDATADALLCESAGCESYVGQDPADRFQEMAAPAKVVGRRVNAVTHIYRITQVEKPYIEPLPEGISAECWFAKHWQHASFTQYPCGDFNVNMLPTMEGNEFLTYVEAQPDGKGYRAAFEECSRRVRGHWHFLQTNYPEFRFYRFSWIAPTLGVRETRRVLGDYVLTERDILGGLSTQDHDDIIALADHARDTHGEGGTGKCGELEEPYGIPLRCLIPKRSDNLLVAGRCASFSHIAASSCRLSRTMMDLGHAAGLTASQSVRTRLAPRHIDASKLRAELRAQGATLEWANTKRISAAPLLQKV